MNKIFLLISAFVILSCSSDDDNMSSISNYPAGSVFCDGEATEIVDVTNPITGRTWMDRNLGAKRAATSPNDEEAYGDLYQWGRFSDGHQCRNSSTAGVSNSDSPGHGDFILNDNNPWDWRVPANVNLWQGVNGTNNPCPDGYRLPTSLELSQERQSWDSNDIEGAFASPLKFTLAGSRSHWPNSGGSVGGGGAGGTYWSSSVHNNKSRALFITEDSIFTGIDSFWPRGVGSSIRCIKDE